MSGAARLVGNDRRGFGDLAPAWPWLPDRLDRREFPTTYVGTMLSELAPFDAGGDLRVVVECPRGARVKLAWDEALGAMTLSRPLPLGFRYPFDWGFVPGTRAADGDPVDAMIVWDVASYPGVVIPCRALGVVELSQDDGRGGRERNDRILAVPSLDPRSEHLSSIDGLPRRVRDEIAQFFLSSVYFEPKNPEIVGWADADGAASLVRRSTRA